MIKGFAKKLPYVRGANMKKNVLKYCFKRQVVFLFLFIFFIFSSLAVSGCREDTEKKSATEAYSVEDFTKTTLKFQEKPKKIVSMSISTDEILLDLVDTDRILALSYLVDDPNISNVKERAMSIKQRVKGRNAEAIMALGADLILAPDFTAKEVIQTLRDLSMKVYVYKTPQNLAEIRQCINLLAQAVGEKKRGDEIIATMDEKVKNIQQKISHIKSQDEKRVVFIGADGVYYNPDSSFDDICKFAKVKNALAETTLKKAGYVNQEEIVRLNPDAFILASWNYDGKHDPDTLVNELLKNPSYKSTPAIRHQEIYLLPARHLLSLSQFIVYAIEDMANIFYLKKDV